VDNEANRGQDISMARATGPAKYAWQRRGPNSKQISEANFSDGHG